MKKNIIFICLFWLLHFFAPFLAHVQSATPQEILNQYISDLQKNPNDIALREKIIRHVQTMSPAPAVTEEAGKYMDRGIAAIEGAKTEEDFRAASAEFFKAVNLAPWLGNAYRNLAIARDKSGQYDAALNNLRLYLLTSPSPADEAWAKSLINKVEYRKEKAAKESAPPAPPEKKKLTDEELIRSLEGARYSGQTRSWSSPPTYIWENEFVIRDGHLSWRQCIIEYGPNSVRELPLGSCYTHYGNAGRMRIEGRVATQILDGWKKFNTFTISEDGNSISHEWGPNTFIFYRR